MANVDELQVKTIVRTGLHWRFRLLNYYWTIGASFMFNYFIDDYIDDCTKTHDVH